MKIRNLAALLIVATGMTCSMPAQTVQSAAAKQKTPATAETRPAIDLSKVPLQATSLNGKITHKDTGLVVSTVGARLIAINVGINAKTVFSLNGTMANFADISVGDSVVVKYLPLSDHVINAINVEAHRHRAGHINDILEPGPRPEAYKYCPYVGSGGTVGSSYVPCYCKKCGGAGSGMIW